jgi:ABC-2 type transport system ATP-binding protein
MHRGRIEVAGTVGEVVAGRGDRISFELPRRVQVAELPVLHGTSAEVTLDGGRAIAAYRVGALQASLRELLRWADALDIELSGLQARSASLEDVFLRTAEEGAAS